MRRLSWCKIWKIGKKGDDVKVTSVVWKPDGTILAIGYSSGDVVLVEVETGKIIHSYNPNNQAITALTWVSDAKNSDTVFSNPLESLIPVLGKTKENTDLTSPKVKQSKTFNILWIGFSNSLVCGYLFGLFPCCEFKTSEVCGIPSATGDVLQISANSNQSQLTLVIKHASACKEIYVVNLNTALISHCCSELLVLGVLYQKIIEQIDLLEKALKDLHEAWQDALVDLESKMAHYKNSNGESSLSVDLMELLMFGHADMKLEKFLVNELTDKGLKRIGQAVELSYANMQKLLVKQITVANYTLSHLVTQLNGLAQVEDKYSCLGLQTESCLAAFRAVGSFTAKTAELQQVIDGSIKYLKTFFRWLYVTILRLAEEPIPTELTSSSQQDVRFIANFLAKDLETDGCVRLDRIGQYLREDPLTLVSSSKTRPWNLLADSANLNTQQKMDLFHPMPRSSLSQEFKSLKNEVSETFHSIPSTVGQTLSVHYTIGMVMEDSSNNQAKPYLSSFCLTNEETSHLLLASTLSPSNPRGFYLVEFPCENRTGEKAKAAMFTLGTGSFSELAEGSIECMEFYNEKILAVLALSAGNHKTTLLQLRLDLLRAELRPIEMFHSPFMDNSATAPSIGSHNLQEVNLLHVLDPTSIKCFDDFLATNFSLNCSRKVGAIYSSVKRKIRILDMEVDENDDEECEGTEELVVQTGNGFSN